MRPKWLKKFFDPQTQKKYFHKHPGLFNFDRECVARGVAIGLFIGMIPVIPFQTILVILFCILIRGNFVIAFLTSWISNPITLVPLTYLTYSVGDWILGKSTAEAVETVRQVSLKWDSLHEFSSSFSAWILQFGKGFFIGLPILAVSASIIGYLAVHLFWDLGAKIYRDWQRKKR